MTAAKTPPPATPEPASNYFTPKQVEVMLKPIHPKRVFETQGQHNVAAWEIKAHLNRVLGFGRWSADVIAMEMIYDLPTMTKGYNGKPGLPAFHTAYRCAMRLEVNAPDGTLLASYTEWAVGDATMPDFKHADVHDMAIKTAESQALKRCAINLGDQFGLGLYDKFNDMYDTRSQQRKPPSAVVKGTLVGAASTEVPEQDRQVQGDHDPDHPSVDINDEVIPPEHREATQAPQTAATPAEAQPHSREAATQPQQAAQAGEQAASDGARVEDVDAATIPARVSELLTQLGTLSQPQIQQLKAVWAKDPILKVAPAELTTREQIDHAWGLLNQVRYAAAVDPVRAEQIAQAQRHLGVTP